MRKARELGKIDGARIFIEDHGIMTFYLFFDFGGTVQGFGGFCLCEWSEKDNRRIGTAAGMDLMMQLMDFFEVDQFEKIKGKIAYVIRESHHFGAKIIGLERPKFEGGKKFMIEDWHKRWFPEDQ
jgi:hypothetical protein